MQAMTADDLYDAGLAVQLAALTGDTTEAWDRAIAAWRYCFWDPDHLVEMVMLGEDVQAADIEQGATGSFIYAHRQIAERVRDLGYAILPRWLARRLVR